MFGFRKNKKAKGYKGTSKNKSSSKTKCVSEEISLPVDDVAEGSREEVEKSLEHNR